MKSFKPPRPMPIFMMLFFSMFGFIGLTMLIFLWSRSMDGFGGPVIIFRLVGSFIALAFMIMGFGLPLSVLFNRSNGDAGSTSSAAKTMATDLSSSSSPTVGYRCRHCGAALGKDQEVSPKGDVKCSYCQKWWNIHEGA